MCWQLYEEQLWVDLIWGIVWGYWWFPLVISRLEGGVECLVCYLSAILQSVLGRLLSSGVVVAHGLAVLCTILSELPAYRVESMVTRTGLDAAFAFWSEMLLPYLHNE
jgi:hypothetical protein